MHFSGKQGLKFILQTSLHANHHLAQQLPGLELKQKQPQHVFKFASRKMELKVKKAWLEAPMNMLPAEKEAAAAEAKSEALEAVKCDSDGILSGHTPID